MKSKTYFRSLLSSILFLSLIISVSVKGENGTAKDTITPIEAIDVDLHLDNYITTKGLVMQYTPSDEEQNQTAYYLLKGEYGQVIPVHTSSKKPTINRKYKVKGIVKADSNDQPYLVEISKKMILPIWVFLAAGGALLLILAIVLLLTLGNRASYEPHAEESEASSEKAASGAGAGKASGQEDIKYDDDFKTVKIVTKAYKLTLVDMKGSLKILDGDDAGKEFKLRGKLAGDMGILSIGSVEKEGVDKATHIHMMERTVSRKQAELIYYRTTKKLVLKNLSKVNYSQVNGEEIMVDEVRELNSGDNIKLGIMKLQYLAD